MLIAQEVAPAFGKQWLGCSSTHKRDVGLQKRFRGLSELHQLLYQISKKTPIEASELLYLTFVLFSCVG